VQVLSALTPPLLMCAAVVVAVVAFLRHETGKKRPDESEPQAERPISDRQREDEPIGPDDHAGHG
jgi:hypothetical protein